MFIPDPDPDLDFLPIPDPNAPDPGSGSATLMSNTSAVFLAFIHEGKIRPGW
jgi:hypothetical protein